MLDVSIFSLLDHQDECHGEYLYHLLVPWLLEHLCQANTRGIGIRSHNAMVFEGMNNSFLRYRGNVVFCHKNTSTLEEFPHRLLWNISSNYTAR
jgi:hypothetical protein